MADAAVLLPALPLEVAHALVRECLREFDHVRVEVRGGCMAPALCEGETVLVAPASNRKPRLGDVVLVRLPDGLRLHRLVVPAMLPRSLWRTQADQGLLWDPPPGAAGVLGTVVGVLGEDGRARSARDLCRAWRSLLRGMRSWLGGGSA